MKQRQQERGFTIVELMIATLVFSTILLLLTFGLMQIGRMYYKGVTSSRTQEVARDIMDEISQAIQFSGGKVAPGSNVVCVDTKRFSYLLGKQLSDNPSAPDQVKHVLVVDNEPTCATAGTQDLSGALSSSSQELLVPNMRLSRLYVRNQPGSTDLWEITIRISYGDEDLLEDKIKNDGTAGTDGVLDTCGGFRAGTQFCAVSELTTTVQKRIK